MIPRGGRTAGKRSFQVDVCKTARERQKERESAREPGALAEVNELCQGTPHFPPLLLLLL